MPSLNKVMIIGNVGNEPEMRFTPNGKPVTSFSVATNWVYTSPEGERRQETESPASRASERWLGALLVSMKNSETLRLR